MILSLKFLWSIKILTTIAVVYKPPRSLGLYKSTIVLKQNFVLRPGNVVASAHEIQYSDLPKYDDLYASSDGEVLNHIRRTESDEKCQKIHEKISPDKSPSEKSAEILDSKLSKIDERIATVINQYRSIFIQENPGDPFEFMDYPEVTLPVKPNAPSYLRPPYRKVFSEADQAAVDIWIQQSLASGLIEKSDGAPIASPLLVVRKLSENGSIKRRFIVDNRLVNRSCLENIAIPFPDIMEGIRTLGTDGMFTSLDVKSAFFRLRVDKKSRRYTTFISQGGKMVGTYSFVSLTQGGIIK